MNSKALAVIRREFTARVRTKTFVITTILLPVLMIAVSVAPILIMGAGGPDHATRIAVVDGTSMQLGQHVQDMLGKEKLSDEKDSGPRYKIDVVPASGDIEATRKELVAKTGFSRKKMPDGYDGVLVLPRDVLETGRLTYYGSNASSLTAMQKLRGSLTKVFASTRLTKAGLDVNLVAKAMRPVHMHASKVSSGKPTGQSGMTAYFIAYGMCFLLYLVILMFGQQTMTSVIEEKTSRVVEVLVSSLTPFQMLLGKVIGVGSAGLLQMAIWGVSAWLITSQGAHIATLFGIDPATVARYALPHISGALVVVFLLYFVLGYLIYGALFAAIGSMCNNVQDSQQYAVIVTMMIMVGFFTAFAVIQNPDGTLAEVLGWIPIWAPFVMPVRWSLTSVPVYELAGSLALMVAGMLFCVWLAGRIYQTGILMFGKKPSWSELWRWIRTS
ncbi:MAG TPA: ABC transporter permease [Oleiagrimonas sp.]|nr:ABC transporter permease [Oleiagrimonas sp.]HET7300179.1 ABC transporter permease [Oleiagrimonas sp.]